MPKPLDITYQEDCGCRVTFFLSAGFRTSRFVPGPDCIEHSKTEQIDARDLFMDRARAYRETIQKEV